MQPNLQTLTHRLIATRIVAAEARRAAIACSKARSLARRIAYDRNINAICATWTSAGGNAEKNAAHLRARAEATAEAAAADVVATRDVRLSRAVREAAEGRALAAKDALKAAQNSQSALFCE